MELKRLKCPICGKNIDPSGIDLSSRIARCPACDETYIIEQAQNFARVEVDKTKDIQNYRQNLARAIDVNDAPSILRCAQKILDILPDDYEAKYFFAYGKAKHEDDDRLLYGFLDDDALDCTDEAQERIVMHLIKYSNIRDEKRIVQFIGRMGSASERYLNLYRQEFEKKAEEEELYDDITRDVFICHRSTDGEVANRIVRELERDGNKCWISSRNLRPNDNENYWDDIHRAVKSCRIFLVVSSRDAMISADVKKEIAYAKELNKKRLEVKIDDSEHTALFKDFFDGYKWIKGEDYPEIKRRVAELLTQELTVPDLLDKDYSSRQSAVKLFEEQYAKAETNRKKIQLIQSFYVPNTPKDLVEFAFLASANTAENAYSPWAATNPISFQQAFGMDAPLRQVSDAWMAKLEQIYHNAMVSLKGTPQLDTIKNIYFSKKERIQKLKRSSVRTYALLFLAIGVLLFGLLVGGVYLMLK